MAIDHKLNYWLIQDLLKNFTCPTTGFWQVEQFPLEEVGTPCLLRSDWRRPNILSNEPPEDAGGREAVCCGDAATVTAGWHKKKEKKKLNYIKFINIFK